MFGVLLDMSAKALFVGDNRRCSKGVCGGPLVDRPGQPPAGRAPEPVLHGDGDESDILTASGQMAVDRESKDSGDDIIRAHAALPISGRLGFASSPTTPTRAFQ